MESAFICGTAKDTNRLQIATVNSMKALAVSNNNVGKEFTVTYGPVNLGTSSILVLSSNNTSSGTKFSYATDNVANFSFYDYLLSLQIVAVSERFYINVDRETNLKIYAIINIGYEVILYASTTGSDNIFNGTDQYGDVYPFSTILHINRIEASNQAVCYVYGCNSSNLLLIQPQLQLQPQLHLLTLIILDSGNNTYCNPVYLCPKGRTAVIKGFNYMTAVATNSYSFVIYKPDIGSGTYTITFPYRFDVASGTSTNYKTHWSDTGLVTIREGEWCVLLRLPSTTANETNLELQAIFCEYLNN